jgi:hypothetical protein
MVDGINPTREAGSLINLSLLLGRHIILMDAEHIYNGKKLTILSCTDGQIT